MDDYIAWLSVLVWVGESRSLPRRYKAYAYMGGGWRIGCIFTHFHPRLTRKQSGKNIDNRVYHQKLSWLIEPIMAYIGYLYEKILQKYLDKYYTMIYI